jgi:hypothetical protein
MRDILTRVLEELSYFHPWPGDDGTIAIPYVWQPGESRCCVVLGPNGGGKSFFRRLIQAASKDLWGGVECIHLSMEARAGSMMYGPMRAMVYGDEGRCSTGELSGHVVTTGIKTCRGRTQEHFIYWDEPDIGMGENEAAGCGLALADFVTDLPELTRCVFVTSHSRHLLRQLEPLRPHYVHLGETHETAPQSLPEWLDRPVTPVRPEAVSEASRARYKAILAILKSVDKKRTNG